MTDVKLDSVKQDQLVTIIVFHLEQLYETKVGRDAEVTVNDLITIIDSLSMISNLPLESPKLSEIISDYINRHLTKLNMLNLSILVRLAHNKKAMTLFSPETKQKLIDKFVQQTPIIKPQIYFSVLHSA